MGRGVTSSTRPRNNERCCTGLWVLVRNCSMNVDLWTFKIVPSENKTKQIEQKFSHPENLEPSL